MIQPRRDSDWLRRKFQDVDRRIAALENGRRLDAEGGDGLGRPWLVFGQVYNDPVTELWPSTTSATYDTLAFVSGFSQHPYILVYFNWWIADAATTGDYRIALDPFLKGDTIHHDIGSFAGPNSGIAFPFVVPSPVGFSEILHIRIDARRTAGTGTVNTSLGGVWGVGLEGNPFPVLP